MEEGGHEGWVKANYVIVAQFNSNLRTTNSAAPPIENHFNRER